MKLLIDHKKIINSPFEDYSNKQDEELVSQLEQQLLYGNPSCFLVSGYRGTGKTSLIRKVEKKLKVHSNVIFVYLNFTKYENYTLVLRKLIREAYLKLSENVNYPSFKRKNPEIAKSLELLYERTFYEVLNSSGSKMTSVIENASTFNINLKRIAASLMITLASVLNLIYGTIPFYSKAFSVIPLLLGILWTGLESAILSRKISKKKANYREMSRKSLYDDEIAEYHIMKVLSAVKEHFKIIFVLDELDKIENQEEIEAVICELKPVMLSDLASFIIVSGQKLFYKLTNSNTKDDSLISSIFSKLVHVPLLNDKSLESVFRSITDSESDPPDPMIKLYTDSLILNSNRIIRRFLNLICQDIIWEKENAYLSIKEEDFSIFETDSRLLSIVSQVIGENIETYKCAEGIRDFFTIQLHLWVHKIKLKGRLYFKKDDIFDFEKDYSSIYPYWCAAQLNHLCLAMLESMADMGFLERKAENEESISVTYYRWTDKASLKVEETLMNSEQIKTHLVYNLIELEQHLRDVYLDVSDNTSSISGKTGINTIIKNLMKTGMLDDSWQSREVAELISYSSKIKQGGDTGEGNLELIQETDFKVKRLLGKLIEQYSFFVIRNYLKEFNYEVNYLNSQSKGSITNRFIAAGKNEFIKDIIFDIKYRNSSSSNDENVIMLMINTLIKYNKEKEKKNKFAILWYNENDTNAYELFCSRFDEVLFTEFPELKPLFYFFKISENGIGFNSTRLKECMNTLLDD